MNDSIGSSNRNEGNGRPAREDTPSGSEQNEACNAKPAGQLLDSDTEQLARDQLQDEVLREVATLEAHRRSQRQRLILVVYLSFLSLGTVALLGYLSVGPAFLSGFDSRRIQLLTGVLALLISSTVLLAYLQGRYPFVREIAPNMARKAQSIKVSDDPSSHQLLDARRLQWRINFSKDWRANQNQYGSGPIRRLGLVGELRSEFGQTKARLTEEVTSLKVRGNVNLVIGILITAIALIMLSVIAFGSPFDQTVTLTTSSVLVYFIPRILLVVFTELFALFFLRLYRASLAEAKYYQNELTIIEAMHLALLVAIERDDEALVSDVVLRFASIERNQAFETRQGMTELERLRLGGLPNEQLAKQSSAVVRGILSKK